MKILDICLIAFVSFAGGAVLESVRPSSAYADEPEAPAASATPHRKAVAYFDRPFHYSDDEPDKLREQIIWAGNRGYESAWEMEFALAWQLYSKLRTKPTLLPDSSEHGAWPAWPNQALFEAREFMLAAGFPRAVKAEKEE